ncbi:hypothetical protein BH09BAC4_BH09BAC4_20970 [soil metagenome]
MMIPQMCKEFIYENQSYQPIKILNARFTATQYKLVDLFVE